MKLSNWGNYPVAEAEVKRFATELEAEQVMAGWPDTIARGLGRCYGDSSLGPHVLSTLSFNRFIEFDAENGILTAQAGVSFEEMLRVAVPKGWFVPVTPGTKFVTLGGAIASDVHGKNHHSDGSFSRHLLSFRLMAADGQVYHCTRHENSELFWATCGGMGLTGLLLDATFQLKKIETSWIRERSFDVKNIEAMFKLFEGSMDSTYSVAWVDCLARGKRLGKGLLLLGEHARRDELKTKKQLANPLSIPQKMKLGVPFFMPSFTLNRFTIKAFNSLFYLKGKKSGKPHLIDYDTYFYPLDGIHAWNRVYGRRGFAQYQFVIPPEKGFDGMVRILEKISQRKMPSFLTVLKYMGPQEGMLSFPMEGYTLALDFPMTKKLLPFLDELDEIVLRFGGRLYLTKDARMKPDMFSKGYPRLQEFLDIKAKVDAGGYFRSMQSERLGI